MIVFIPHRPVVLVLGMLSGLIFAGFLGSSLLEGKDPFVMNRSETTHTAVKQPAGRAILEHGRPRKAPSTRPGDTFCDHKETDSKYRGRQPIVVGEPQTVLDIGSLEAYRELHSVKVFMSCNTANPPESEIEYSTCLSRPLKSVRMIRPSLSISRSCCERTFFEAWGNILQSWLSRTGPLWRLERIPIFHFP